MSRSGRPLLPVLCSSRHPVRPLGEATIATLAVRVETTYVSAVFILAEPFGAAQIVELAAI